MYISRLTLTLLRGVGPALLCLTLLGPTQAVAQDSEPLPTCELTDIQTIHWDAVNQDVTLTTHLTHDGTELPRASFILQLADGTKIDLGHAGKLRDEASHEFSGCASHLETATQSVSLNIDTAVPANPYPHALKTLADLDGAIIAGQDCQSPGQGPIRPRSEMSRYCKTAFDTWQEYMSSQDELSQRYHQYEKYDKNSESYPDDMPPEKLRWPDGRYQQLVEQKAPIIHVARSTYYMDIMVYDPIDKVMRYIMPSGC